MLKFPNLTAKSVTKKIAAAIDASTLTHRQIAAKLHVHENTIGNWKKGPGVPNVVELQQLARVLNLPLLHFLGVNAHTIDVPDSPTRRDVERLAGEILRLVRAPEAAAELRLVDDPSKVAGSSEDGVDSPGS